MQRVLINVGRALNRIIPDCVTLRPSTVAFNMFLAFFPLFLLALGFFAICLALCRCRAREVPDRLSLILPPGSMIGTGGLLCAPCKPSLCDQIFLGLGGTLLAGTQWRWPDLWRDFRVIEGVGPAGAELLAKAIARALSSLRHHRAHARGGGPHGVWQADPRVDHAGNGFGERLARCSRWYFTQSLFFTLAMAVLILLYRIGRPGHRGLLNLFPGATVSTVLWWAADISFGFYMRKMPYDFVYRGLAAAIGLLLWMFLTAIVVFIGAAYNAEVREAQEAARLHRRSGVSPGCDYRGTRRFGALKNC